MTKQPMMDYGTAKDSDRLDKLERLTRANELGMVLLTLLNGAFRLAAVGFENTDAGDLRTCIDNAPDPGDDGD